LLALEAGLVDDFSTPASKHVDRLAQDLLLSVANANSLAGREIMPAFLSDVSATLGLNREAAALTFLQISLRGVLVFFATLVIVRCGDRRFLSQKTAFDAVLGFILASMLARAVNGTAAFFPTLGGAFLLVMLHRVLAYASRRSHGFGNLIKGRSDVLIKDGKLDEAVAERNGLSHHDVMEDLRLHGNVGNVADVAVAVFERDGRISVVPKRAR
jgi:uncharacterized membrane protein YcaP (DUF421 family)